MLVFLRRHFSRKLRRNLVIQVMKILPKIVRTIIIWIIACVVVVAGTFRRTTAPPASPIAFLVPSPASTAITNSASAAAPAHV